MNIGWIGLGNMGIPMATQLIGAAYQVAVYNRSKGKESELQKMGATTADTPQALLKKVDIVILMVSDDQAIEQIFEGEMAYCLQTQKVKSSSI